MSQMCAKDEYCWEDLSLGEAEVTQALAGLRASQPGRPIRGIAQPGHAPEPAEEEVVDPDN
ncbi:MAG TPA: hypothetical protein PLM74_05930, partial [Bacillota bacterium]|nr:hypothetical protein [Bacillota bacterium]